MVSEVTAAVGSALVPRLGVPAYFHPSWAGPSWACLLAGGPLDRPGRRVELAILNPDSGVGTDPDEAYRVVSGGLRACGVTAVGYVDTGYGRRPAGEVVAEFAAYHRWYGLSAIFLDQVRGDHLGWPYYARLVDMLRANGARRVVLNPGVAPEPAYLGLADLVVTFEGSWATYQNWQPPPWCGWMSARVWHLVYDTPPAARRQAVEAAAARGAGYLYLTDRTLPNPWDELPTYWSWLATTDLESEDSP